MKFIEGKIRLKGKWEKLGNRVWINGRELKPDYSQTVWNKSPTGFAWGHLGSGPSQLALAVGHPTNKKKALRQLGGERRQGMPVSATFKLNSVGRLL